MRRASLPLLTAVGLLIGHASAADAAEDPGWVVGEGGHSCGDFILALRQHAADGQSYNHGGANFLPESDLYEQWIWGYVSAQSFRYHLKARSDGSGITLWVAHWCESHGDESVASAAGAFVAHLLNEK